MLTMFMSRPLPPQHFGILSCKGDERTGEEHTHTNIYIYTGLFISPSGISDPCGTVAGMVTPKGSMSTEGETLQVSVLPYRYSIC